MERWNGVQTQPLLVQRYVKPFLICDRKWDMRIYVIVTAFVVEETDDLALGQDDSPSDCDSFDADEDEGCDSFVVISDLEDEGGDFSGNDQEDFEEDQEIVRNEDGLEHRKAVQFERNPPEKDRERKTHKKIEQSVWVYQKGIARFCTQKYDLDQLDNKTAHVSNSSINSRDDQTEFSMKDLSDTLGAAGSAPKWNLQSVIDHLQDIKAISDSSCFWSRIESIVTHTMEPLLSSLGVQWSTSGSPASSFEINDCKCSSAKVNLRVPCQQFEVLGFDILLSDLDPSDDKEKKGKETTLSRDGSSSLEGRMFLLEVNGYPSLSCDCAVDLEVKHSLINDISDLLSANRSLNPSSRPSHSSASILLESLISSQSPMNPRDQDDENKIQEGELPSQVGHLKRLLQTRSPIS